MQMTEATLVFHRYAASKIIEIQFGYITLIDNCRPKPKFYNVYDLSLGG